MTVRRPVRASRCTHRYAVMREKGFGLISSDSGGADVFVHYSTIDAGGCRSLEEDQRVEFGVVQCQKGPQAEHVRLV